MKQALCKVARMQDCKIPNSAPTRLRVYSGQTRTLLRLNSEFAPTKPQRPFCGISRHFPQSFSDTKHTRENPVFGHAPATARK